MLILASNSPRRKELLEKLQINFVCDPVDVDETVSGDLPVSSVAEVLALRKANAGLIKHPDDTVIGSDTIVVINNEILGKPKNATNAKQMLQLLSDSVHKVYTGVAIKNSQKIITFTECTEVAFDNLSDYEIDEYINSGETDDKAGAYAIQGLGSKFIKWIKGDFYNVVGLPINRLYNELKNMER